MRLSALGLSLLLATAAYGQSPQRASLYTPGTVTGTGVLANPLRTDPTGTTTQPVSQITSPWIVAGTSPGGTIPLYESNNTSVVYCRVLVTTTATPLRCGSSNLANRRQIFIFNNGAYAIFMGSDTSVSTVSGFPLPAPSGGLLSATGYVTSVFDVGPSVTLYGISSVINQDVRIIEGS